ncbi:MAG: hypothetical protein B9S32_04000 [Verrucomicrobia bacterium Tous-C9LFEB]|nr:MAG: hypothetical protein B9S32_04000 [Verrucomicrobia bacterium Tous-C9LFEB]
MKKALRYLGFAVAGVLILVVAVLTAFYLWLNSYLKGEDFRTLVSAKTSESLQLKGEFLPFHWAGFSVHSDGYFGKGNDGNPLVSVRADQIRADLNLGPILDGVWNVPRVDIQSLNVEIDPAVPPAPALEAAPAVTRPTAPASSDFFSRFLPRRVDLDTIFIARANFLLKTTPTVTLQELQLTLTPEGGTWNIDATGGKLKHPDWPLFTVQRAKLRASDSQLFLTQVDLQLQDSGQISVSGDINSRDTAPLNLRADVQRAPITAFLTGDWRARLMGNLNGVVKWTGDLRGPQAIQAAGNLKLLEGRIEALPFLNQIATFTKTEEFRSLKLHKASADFIWVPKQDRLEVTNLVLESEGLVRVQGKFTVQNNIIDGRFSLGTVPSVLKYIPGAESQVFTEKRDGYIWTPLNLTGPLQSPTEDLTPKLKTAAVNSIGETANQGLQQVIDAAKSLLPF